MCYSLWYNAPTMLPAVLVLNLKYNEKQESVSIASLTVEEDLSGDSHQNLA